MCNVFVLFTRIVRTRSATHTTRTIKGRINDSELLIRKRKGFVRTIAHAQMSLLKNMSALLQLYTLN